MDCVAGLSNEKLHSVPFGERTNSNCSKQKIKQRKPSKVITDNEWTEHNLVSDTNLELIPPVASPEIITGIVGSSAVVALVVATLVATVSCGVSPN